MFIIETCFSEGFRGYFFESFNQNEFDEKCARLADTGRSGVPERKGSEEPAAEGEGLGVRG